MTCDTTENRKCASWLSESDNVVIHSKFVEVEQKINDKTSAWYYFLRSENKKLGKCKEPLCQKILKADGGTTSGLITHLRTKHNIDLRKKKNEIDSTVVEEGKI